MVSSLFGRLFLVSKRTLYFSGGGGLDVSIGRARFLGPGTRLFLSLVSCRSSLSTSEGGGI